MTAMIQEWIDGMPKWISDYIDMMIQNEACTRSNLELLYGAGVNQGFQKGVREIQTALVKQK